MAGISTARGIPHALSGCPSLLPIRVGRWNSPCFQVVRHCNIIDEALRHFRICVGGELFDDFWVVSNGGVFGEVDMDGVVFVGGELSHPLGP